MSMGTVHVSGHQSQANQRGLPLIAVAALALAVAGCSVGQGTTPTKGVGRQGTSDVPVNWLMFHGDPQRSGWNSNETILSPAALRGGNFGQLWTSDDLDTFGGKPAHLYASPLYVNSVTMTTDQYDQMQFSVVIAASNNAWVYAINAGDGIVPKGAILWKTTLGTPGCCYDGIGTLPTGIMGTPIIDLNATPPTIYVASDVTEGGEFWRVFALELGSGKILNQNWPLTINNSTVQPVIQNGPAVFQATRSMDQRGGLNLSPDGTVLYIPFGAYGDNASGFLVAIDTGRVSGMPAILSAFAGSPSVSSPRPPAAGMWASGGTAIDPNGTVYVTTGNGPFNPVQDPPLPGYWSMSVLAFAPVGPPDYTLQLSGTYSPWNHCQMDKYDADLGGGGIISFNIVPTLTSTPNLLAAGGKQGMGYLLDRNNLSTADRMPPCHWVSSDPLRKLDPTASPRDGSLFGPDTHPYYKSEDGLGQDRPGPLSLFGPYTENCTAGNQARARSTPVYFQDASGTNYVFFTGATKAGVCSQNPVPPGVVRTRVVTPGPSQPAYLTIDAQDNSLSFESPGTAVISSNGNDLTSAVLWVLEPHVFRGGSLGGSQPQLYAVDASSMSVLQVVYSSDLGLLGPGAKYNAPTVANGVVYVGTDKITAFGLQ